VQKDVGLGRNRDDEASKFISVTKREDEAKRVPDPRGEGE